MTVRRSDSADRFDSAKPTAMSEADIGRGAYSDHAGYKDEGSRASLKDPHSWKLDPEALQNSISHLMGEPSRTRRCCSRPTLFLILLFSMLAFLLLGNRVASSNVEFEDIKDKIPWLGPRKAVVIAGFMEQNTSWIADVPYGWEVHHYVADDPAHKPALPINQGREAMTYLTFIIDNYEKLPDYNVFVHGHNVSWHQERPMPIMLRALDLHVVKEHGWISLRCATGGSCDVGMKAHPLKQTWFPIIEKTIKNLYEYAYKPADPWYEPLPEELGAACCAQFAVTREQIRTKPLEFYLRLREPLLRDIKKEFADWELDEWDPSWPIGGALELSWHWIFGMAPVTCISEDYCNTVLFRDKIHCDGRTSEWLLAMTDESYKNITCLYDDVPPPRLGAIPAAGAPPPGTAPVIPAF